MLQSSSSNTGSTHAAERLTIADTLPTGMTPSPSSQDTTAVAHGQAMSTSNFASATYNAAHDTAGSSGLKSHASPNPVSAHGGQAEHSSSNMAYDSRHSQRVPTSPVLKSTHTTHQASGSSQASVPDKKVFEESLVNRRHLALPSESDLRQKLSDTEEVLSPTQQRYMLARVSAVHRPQPMHQPAPPPPPTPTAMPTYFHGYATPVYGSAAPVVPLAGTPQVRPASK